MIGERLAVDVADAQALKGRAAAGDPEALRSAARQFESLLVAQMLKAMRETRFNDEDDPLSGGDGVRLYRELLDQQWAAKLTNGRGLGFAEMMVRAMEARGMAQASNPATPGASAVLPAAGVASSSVEARTDSGMAVAEFESSSTARPAAETLAGVAGVSRKQAFLATMQPHAEAAAAATGVPSRFILAHAALESGWGRREIRGADGAASHNLFGIKAGAGWTGAAVRILTTEYRQGLPMKLEQSFRAYDDYSEAFTDYARLLKSRYGEALSRDGDAFAQGLAAGGYATDPAYAGKLKAVIASVAMAGG